MTLAYPCLCTVPEPNRRSSAAGQGEPLSAVGARLRGPVGLALVA